MPRHGQTTLSRHAWQHGRTGDVATARAWTGDVAGVAAPHILVRLRRATAHGASRPGRSPRRGFLFPLSFHSIAFARRSPVPVIVAPSLGSCTVDRASLPTPAPPPLVIGWGSAHWPSAPPPLVGGRSATAVAHCTCGSRPPYQLVHLVDLFASCCTNHVLSNLCCHELNLLQVLCTN